MDEEWKSLSGVCGYALLGAVLPVLPPAVVGVCENGLVPVTPEFGKADPGALCAVGGVGVGVLLLPFPLPWPCPLPAEPGGGGKVYPPSAPADCDCPPLLMLNVNGPRGTAPALALVFDERAASDPLYRLGRLPLRRSCRFTLEPGNGLKPLPNGESVPFAPEASGEGASNANWP